MTKVINCENNGEWFMTVTIYFIYGRRDFAARRKITMNFYDFSDSEWFGHLTKKFIETI
jgi:hypothetical protein